MLENIKQKEAALDPGGFEARGRQPPRLEMEPHAGARAREQSQEDTAWRLWCWNQQHLTKILHPECCVQSPVLQEDSTLRLLLFSGPWFHRDTVFSSGSGNGLTVKKWIGCVVFIIRVMNWL